MADIPVYYVGSTYCIFALLWIIIVLWNKFYLSSANFILLIPLIIFTIGFFNLENLNDDLQNDVFRVTFISVGLLLSLPLLKLFNEKKENRMLNHVIFLSMIFILVSYYHFWVPSECRYVCKIIQSCLETFSITLYIFALTIFFML